MPQLPDKNDAGAAPFSSHATEIRIAFKKEWISRKGDPSKMALIKISGDSMVPTLLPGDLVLIDHGRNRLDHQGGIYAISVNRQLMIKRLQGEPPLKRIRIISDNPKYSLIEAKRDQVHIKGKVIWFGRDLER